MNRKKALALVLMLGICAPSLTGCTVTDGISLVRINGGKDKISYGYGKFAAKTTQALYDLTYSTYMGEGMWQSDPSGTGKTMEESVKENVMNSLEEQYILVSNASKYKVKLTKAEKKKIDKAADKFMKANSKKALKTLGAKEDYVKKYLTDQAISEKVRTKIEEKADTTVTDAEANQKKLSVVFFNTITKTDENGKSVVVTDKEKAEMKTKAEAIAAAADFDAEAKNQGVEPGTLTYGKTVLDTAKSAGSTSDSNNTQIPYDVLKKADKLTDGQNTGLIDLDQGYFVIKMVSTSDKESTETAKSQLIETKKTNYFQSVVDKIKAKTAWNVNEFLWKRVRFIDEFKNGVKSK